MEFRSLCIDHLNICERIQIYASANQKNLSFSSALPKFQKLVPKRAVDTSVSIPSFPEEWYLLLWSSVRTGRYYLDGRHSK